MDKILIDVPLNEQGLTELHLGAYRQDLEWVRNCLQAGFSVNKTSRNGYTPLVWAISMAATSEWGVAENIIDLLLESGADIHIIPTGYTTILEFAAQIDEAVYQHLKLKIGEYFPSKFEGK